MGDNKQTPLVRLLPLSRGERPLKIWSIIRMGKEQGILMTVLGRKTCDFGRQNLGGRVETHGWPAARGNFQSTLTPAARSCQGCVSGVSTGIELCVKLMVNDLGCRNSAMTWFTQAIQFTPVYALGLYIMKCQVCA